MPRRILQTILALPVMAACFGGWLAVADGALSIRYFSAVAIVGLLALFCSIAVEPKEEEGPVRWLITVGLVVGLLLDLWLGIFWLRPSADDLSGWLITFALLGGPLIVASWNLSLLLRKRKNA